MSNWSYKTSEEILAYFCTLAGSGSIAGVINGNIYQDGVRPRDSQKEDMVFIYTSGVTFGERVKGEITVNLYVPDVQPYTNGVYVKDGARLVTLSQYLQTWASSLPGTIDYKITQTEPIRVVEDREIHQHFLVLHLQYEYCLTN